MSPPAISAAASYTPAVSRDFPRTTLGGIVCIETVCSDPVDLTKNEPTTFNTSDNILPSENRTVGQQSRSSFMELPTEIRMQIYRHLHEMHPIPSLIQVLPWYPVPPLKPYRMRELRLDDNVDDGFELDFYSAGPLPEASAKRDFENSSLAGSDDDPASDSFGSDSSTLSRTTSISSQSSYNPPFTPSALSPKHWPRQYHYRHHHYHTPAHRNLAHLLPPSRPSSRLPTSLLLTSRTLYHESRTIPFMTNEFVFPTWFTSGLCSATNFFTTRLTADWQRDSVRWVRVELLSKDLEAVGQPPSDRGLGPGGMGYISEWSRLCSSLSHGCRGLRIKVLAAQRVWFGAAWDTATGLGAFNGDITEPNSASITSTIPPPSATTTTTTTKPGGRSYNTAAAPRGIVGVLDSRGDPRPWVTHGLALLRGLRQLEVELCPTTGLITAAEAAERAEGGGDLEGRGRGSADTEGLASVEETRLMIQWCTDLENVLNGLRDAGEEHVRVVCVGRHDAA